MRLGDFDTKTRQQARKRSLGYCECGLVCGKTYIGDGPSHADHIKPIWLWDLTDPEQLKQCKSLANCQIVCVKCHSLKTGKEAGVRAKTDRIRRKHNGLPQQKKRKLQSKGFDKTMRKRMNGKVERKCPKEPWRVDD